MFNTVKILLIWNLLLILYGKNVFSFVIRNDDDDALEYDDSTELKAALRDLAENLKDIQDLDLDDINFIEQMDLNEYKKSTEEDQKTLKTLRVLLENLRNRGSTFKSVPYPPNVVDKYVNGYLKQIDELSKKMKPSNELQMKRGIKKAVCGSLNGNPSYKWICW